MVCWWIIGIIVMVLNVVFLDWFKVFFGMGFIWVFVFFVEVIIIICYGVIDFWVFCNFNFFW